MLTVHLESQELRVYNSPTDLEIPVWSHWVLVNMGTANIYLCNAKHPAFYTALRLEPGASLAGRTLFDALHWKLRVLRGNMGRLGVDIYA